MTYLAANMLWAPRAARYAAIKRLAVLIVTTKLRNNIIAVIIKTLGAHNATIKPAYCLPASDHYWACMKDVCKGPRKIRSTSVGCTYRQPTLELQSCRSWICLAPAKNYLIDMARVLIIKCS